MILQSETNDRLSYEGIFW